MSKKIIYILVFIFFFLNAYIFFYYSKKPEKISRSEIIMGTLVEIQIESKQDNLEQIIENAFNKIKEVDSTFSVYIDNSEVNKFNNHSDGIIKVSEEFYYLVSLADSLNKISDGAFDIAINNLVKLWKFDEDGELPSAKVIKEQLKYSGSANMVLLNENKIQKSNKVELNFGAIAKGYGVDKAYEYLKKEGIERAYINAGGEVRVIGDDWIIGIQHPRDENKTALRIKFSNEAAATSGDYEKYFIKDEKRYHHIFNPKTGYPAEGIQSVTIIHKSDAIADALSTAVFVLGVDKGMKLIESLSGSAGFIIDSTGTHHYSNSFKKFIVK